MQVCEGDDYQKYSDAQRGEQVEQSHLFQSQKDDDDGDGGDAPKNRVAATPPARALGDGPCHVSTHHNHSRKNWCYGRNRKFTTRACGSANGGDQTPGTKKRGRP